MVGGGGGDGGGGGVVRGGRVGGADHVQTQGGGHHFHGVHFQGEAGGTWRKPKRLS